MPPEDPRKHETRQWLTKAAEDLGLADLLVQSSRFPAATVYHCQQAAEKALKAFLAWQDQPFRKTHDLVELGGLCAALDQTLEPYLRRAAPLTDYAWKFRYPGDGDASAAEAEEALTLSRAVYEQVISRLPVEVHP